MNKDHFILGIVLGLIVPVMGVAVLYTIKFVPQNVSVSDFILLLQKNKSNIPKVISLGMIACIPLIAYYNNRKCMRTLKGIFLSILLYTLLAIAYKFRLL